MAAGFGTEPARSAGADVGAGVFRAGAGVAEAGATRGAETPEEAEDGCADRVVFASARGRAAEVPSPWVST